MPGRAQKTRANKVLLVECIIQDCGNFDEVFKIISYSEVVNHVAIIILHVSAQLQIDFNLIRKMWMLA